MLPRLRERSRQVEAEVVSNSSNKVHQTWEALFWRPLYKVTRNDDDGNDDDDVPIDRLHPLLGIMAM